MYAIYKRAPKRGGVQCYYTLHCEHERVYVSVVVLASTLLLPLSH